MKNVVCVGLLACGVFVVGCNETSEPSGGAKDAAQAAAPVAAWKLAALPAGAVDVTAAKEQAKEGDSVVVRGIVGGRYNAIGEDGAYFVMVDPGVDNPCVTRGDDHCAFPWDYCCTPSDVVAQNSATVRVMDASGAPMGGNLAEQGLEPLDVVVVVGTVGPRPTPQVFVVNATGMYVEE